MVPLGQRTPATSPAVTTCPVCTAAVGVSGEEFFCPHCGLRCELVSVVGNVVTWMVQESTADCRTES